MKRMTFTAALLAGTFSVAAYAADAPVVITVGEHIPRKNHETVLRAVARVEGAQLLFCGVGISSVHKGVTRGFEEDITVPTGSAGKAVRAVGSIGYVARGIAATGALDRFASGRERRDLV